MHRQRTKLVPRTERVVKKIGRGDPLVRTAKQAQFRGIITTYKIHDRLLGNRTARRRYEQEPPQLDDVQRRVLDDLEQRDYAIVPSRRSLRHEALDGRRSEGHGISLDGGGPLGRTGT